MVAAAKDEGTDESEEVVKRGVVMAVKVSIWTKKAMMAVTKICQ